MLSAIATDGDRVSLHFGRCQVYTLIKITNGKIEKREQADNPGHAPGAIPEFLNKKGVKRVICGGIGARATELFTQYGIEVIAGIDSTVENAISELAAGELESMGSPCNPGDGRGYGIEKTECNHSHE